ncbi:MAG: TlpA disulfide reductase family protein [Chitinophagaceae bacterium]|nr:TlpA disulfide reductase family protein [Chitinophagaceae bacterium]
MKLLVKFIPVLFLVTVGANGMGQSIKKWKITDVVNYIEKTDSVVVLTFWATWCKPCITELPYFHSVTKKYAPQKVKLLLVSLDFQNDYPKKIAEFAKKNNYDAEIVWLDETDADYFCPKIDSRWSGAIPSTLIYHHQSGYRFFREGQIREERLELILQEAISKQKQ